MSSQPPRREFATLTHARLRAQQGDVAGARRLLSAILTVEPDHLEARSLLLRLERLEGTGHAEPEAPAAAEPVGAPAAEHAPRLRASLGPRTPRDSARSALRLRAWLDGVTQRRGARGVR